MQKLLPVIRSAAAHAPSEAVDGESYLFPVHLLKSPLEGAGSVEDNEALIVPNLWKAIGGCIGTACKSLKTVQTKQCSPPKTGFRKKKSTILPTKYSAFLVENTGIEPVTSCMPCKRSPEPP